MNLKPLNPIVIVDDEKAILHSMEFTFRSAGYNNVITFQKSELVMDYLSENPIELIFLDITMPLVTGEELLKMIGDQYPEVPVIMITGLNDVKMAVSCMQNGASDYLVKPVERSRLLSSLNRVLELSDLKRQYNLLKERMLSHGLQNAEAFDHIISQNKQMCSIFKYMEAIGQSHEPVLIQGETGTGKELFAQAIYNLYNYSGKYVSVNVAGLDDSMFADTLFGHVGGAFTGAGTSRSGLVEKAENGVLFLDEIGDLSLSSQVKLLRLIHEKEYYPLGSDMLRHANCRIVVATNADLEKKMQSGEFRRDLFYRLSVHNIEIPPLKNRKDDIPILADYFLSMAAEEMNKKCPTVPKEMYSLLESYAFPGNVRELRAMIFNAVSQHEHHVMSLDNITSAISSSSQPGHETEKFSDLETLFCNVEELPTIKKVEEFLIHEAIERFDGNQSMAARVLGITRQTLNKKLKND